MKAYLMNMTKQNLTLLTLSFLLSSATMQAADGSNWLSLGTNIFHDGKSLVRYQKSQAQKKINEEAKNAFDQAIPSKDLQKIVLVYYNQTPETSAEMPSGKKKKIEEVQSFSFHDKNYVRILFCDRYKGLRHSMVIPDCTNLRDRQRCIGMFEWPLSEGYEQQPSNIIIIKTPSSKEKKVLKALWGN